MKRHILPSILGLLLALSTGVFAAEPAADKIKEGNEAIEKNNFDRAIEVFSEVISADANNAEAYSGRGVAHLQTNQIDSGLRDFDEAIRLDPRYAEAYARRAAVNLCLDQPDKAIR